MRRSIDLLGRLFSANDGNYSVYLHVGDSVTDFNPTIAHTIEQTCIAYHIRRANRALVQLFDEALRPAGLRSGQFTVLTALTLAGDVPMTPLADALGMDRTTLTRNLDVLVERGFVKVGSGKDRRRRLVSILPAGRDALAAAYPIWQEIQERLAAGVGDAARLRADLVRVDEIAVEALAGAASLEARARV